MYRHPHLFPAGWRRTEACFCLTDKQHQGGGQAERIIDPVSGAVSGACGGGLRRPVRFCGTAVPDNAYGGDELCKCVHVTAAQTAPSAVTARAIDTKAFAQGVTP